jgi:hypothetical protein
MKRMVTRVEPDGASYAESRPQDTARIVKALSKAGYDVSPRDAAIAWHQAGEDTDCAAWLSLGASDLSWRLPALLRYLQPARDTTVITAVLDEAGVDKRDRAEGPAAHTYSEAERVRCLVMERDRLRDDVAHLRAQHLRLVGECADLRERLERAIRAVGEGS